MISKNYKDQVRVDKLTLNELHKLDYLNKDKFEKFGKINVLSLIFVQLQHYISSSIINKDTKPYFKSNYFPFVNSEYLNKNINFKNKLHYKTTRKNIDKIKKKIYSSVPFAKISTFNVHSDAYKDLEYSLNKNFILRRRVDFKPIKINFLDEQFKIIDNHLENFAKKNMIRNTGYAKNFLNYLNYFFCDEQIKLDDSEYLFVGSNALLENRITSARYLLKKKDVISFNHANYNTLIIDEPHQEYSEHAFCTYYVDYGSLKKLKKKLKSDFLHPKRIININNPKIFKTLSSIKREKKIIFIPDSFTGDRRVGPHRDMDDSKYYKFQKKIVSSSNNILIKKHPKEKVVLNINTLANRYFKFDERKMLKSDLKTMLNKYNLFIVDRISQAFFDVARSDTKILYLDIGRRKIKKKFVKEVKKRALSVKIDPYKITNREILKLIKKAENFEIKKSKIFSIATNSSKQITKEILKLIN